MKKRFFSISLFILCILSLSIQCSRNSDEAYRYKFSFITEEFKPLNYVENSSLTGLAPEVLKVVCQRLNIPFEVKVLPWNEGYSLVQQTDNAVLFSTILNSERKDLFKWAGPIATLDWLFYATPQNHINLNALEDAKLAGRIGVIADYSIEQFLVGQGFTNLVYCSDNIDAFDKLLKGEIDLFPSDRITAEAALNSLNKTIYAVSEKLTIRTDMVYFAFNKKVPDDVVADFQQQIDILKEDGTLKGLYRKFMSSSDIPGTLQLYTEQYPPITFRDNTGEITGFGADLVKELMKRNQQFFDIKLSSWSNGYELALHNPNFCLFTMDRTALRENLFQWVGPIGTNTTWFYTKTGSGITISTLEEAKNLQAVGTVSSWFSDQYLRELGFTNLVSGSEPGVLATKLMNGEIDAFVCSGITFPVILKESGYEYSQVVPSYALMSSDYYIAFSKSTPAAFVSQWQSTLELLKQDGTVEAISKKWLP